MIDRPDATLLLEAMAATLTDKVMPELSGGAQHQARIVANLCDMSAALGGTSQLTFDSFWAAVDRDADGTVSFDEFIQLFRRRDASIASTLTGIA